LAFLLMKEVYSFIPPEVPMPYFRFLDNTDAKIFDWIQEKGREEFGKNSLQYETLMGGIDFKKGNHVNLFFSLYLNQNLSGKMKVPSIEDLARISTIHENVFDSIYCYSRDVLLTCEKQDFKKNNSLLENLAKQVREKKYDFSAKNPLVISGLTVEADKSSDNEYGLLLKVSDETTFRNDLRYSSQTPPKFDIIDYSIPSEGEGLGITTLGVNGNRNIYANQEDFLSVDENDRIGIVYSADNGKQLKEYLEKIEIMKTAEAERIRSELDIISKFKDKL
jgi:hypothetical protein